MMAAYVLCVTSGGGLPVFSRKKGNAENEVKPLKTHEYATKLYSENSKSLKKRLTVTITQLICFVFGRDIGKYVKCATVARKLGMSSSFLILQLPFSIIGSLNGVHMFGKSQKIELLNSLTEDYVVAWKEFSDSLVLIGISSGCTTEVLNSTLQSVFNAVVLIVGIDEVKSQRNIERLKKELRICHSVIDRLLDSLDCGDSANKHSSDLVGMAETILCPENHLIQIVLDTFTECVDSLFSCVLIYGKIAAATDSWWTLHPEEIKLLSLLASTENASSSKDIPVFLPYKSPGVAFRFVCCTLIPDIQLCCLCGPTPILEEVEHSATQCFKNSTDILNSAMQCYPRNFPSTYHIDGGILGLLLVNTTYGKYMITRSPQQSTAKKANNNNSHRLDILKTFYYQSVLTFLVTSDNESASNTEENLQESANKKTADRKEQKGGRPKITDTTEGLETYWCSEYHKCHALRVADNILCALYNSSVPTYAMRLITEKTLKNLVSDKQTCW